VEGRADKRRALAHAKQTEASPALVRRRLEPDTVVPDDQFERAVADIEADVPGILNRATALDVRYAADGDLLRAGMCSWRRRIAICWSNQLGSLLIEMMRAPAGARAVETVPDG
jgi:hypothetical protein